MFLSDSLNGPIVCSCHLALTRYSSSSAAEAIFRQRVAITAHLPAIGQQLRHAIKLGAPRLDCCHEEAATDAIITLVLRAASFLL